MADVLYILAAYWPFVVALFAIGIAVGWWAESGRDASHVSAWLERGQDPVVIIHAAEVWAALAVAFVLGCVLGALLFIVLARTRFAAAQFALADALGSVSNRVRVRFGLEPVWRPKRRVAPPAPVEVEPDDESSALWQVVAEAAAAEPGPSAPRLRASPPPPQRPAADARLPPRPAADVRTPLRRALPVPRAAEAAPRQEARPEPPRLAPRLPPLEPPPVRPLVRRPLLTAPPPEPEPEPPAVPAQPGEGPEIRRPAMLSEPRNGVPDNLQRIRGIGERNEVRLNKLGVFHFSQIAAWTPAEIRWIGQQIAFAERIEHDDWVGQAIVLASGGETGFTKSADRRRARRRGRGPDEGDPDPDAPGDEP